MEEEGPLGLLRVQSLGCTHILQVFVISPYQEGDLGSLQLVTPFLQDQLDRQQLPTADVGVPLSCRLSSQEEGTGVELLIGG